MNRPLILDGCCRGTPRAKSVQMDLCVPFPIALASLLALV